MSHPTLNSTAVAPEGVTVGSPGLLARLVAWLITLYQRHISPRKGFRCAHRVLHRGESCSQFIRRIVLERGVFAAAGMARERFGECREARDVLWTAHMSAADVGAESPGDDTQQDQQSPWYCDLVDLPCDCGLIKLFRGNAAGMADAGADPAGGAADAAGSAAESACGCGDALPFDCCN